LALQAPKVHEESKGSKEIKAYKGRPALKGQQEGLQVHKALKGSLVQREQQVLKAKQVQRGRLARKVFQGNKDLWGHKALKVYLVQPEPSGRKDFLDQREQQARQVLPEQQAQPVRRVLLVQ
jgi:hypothetical protein